MYTTTSVDMEMLEFLMDIISKFALAGVIITIFSIIVMWKVFSKAGKPGWASIIPIYNIVVLFQIAGMNPIFVLAMLVPFVNIVILVMLYLNIAKAFGKSTGFAVGLVLLNVVFMAILAFGSAEYKEIA